MKTKLFTLFLALAASVGTMFAESGTCGENLTWDLTNGVLTISGTGKMTYWNSYDAVPWYSNRLSIQSVVIGDGVTSIGERAFIYCTGLTSVTIPNSVTSIGDWAFFECTGLTSVTIPNSVTSIGGAVFSGCTGLTSVTIPNSVTEIGEWAFVGCTSLTTISVDASNQNYCDIDGVLFNKEQTTLIQYPAGKSSTEYSIPNSVTSIGAYAFSGCAGLISITCEASTPPECRNYVFSEVDKSIPLYVPAGSVEAYKAADQWKDFGDNIKPIQAAKVLAEILESSDTEVLKFIKDGQLLILRDGKTYTITGAEVIVQ